MKKRVVALLVAMVLVIGMVTGGTLAWLVATSSEITNTFTTSDIDIVLAETTDEDPNVEGHQFKMIPGHTIDKDPKVTVLAGSETCWLFVEITESETPAFGDYLTYEVADGWTQGDGTDIPDDVYYRKIDDANDASKIGTPYSVLKEDQVLVLEGVTKAMMEVLQKEGAIQPTLTFKAYASQLMEDNTTEFTAKEAWVNIKK